MPPSPFPGCPQTVYQNWGTRVFRAHVAMHMIPWLPGNTSKFSVISILKGNADLLFLMPLLSLSALNLVDRDERLFEWLELQLSRFERVFCIIGNHELRFLTLVSEFFSYVLILISSLPTQEENLMHLESFAVRFLPITHGSNGEFIFLHTRRYDLSSTSLS